VKILFRVYRRYFDPIASGEKTVELRRRSPSWLGVARSAQRWIAAGEPVVAIVACGADRHLRAVVRVEEDVRAIEVLGRPLSEQGERDLGGADPRVVAFHLGEAVSDG